MIQHVTERDFIQAFKQLRPENFSHGGLCVLYEHLTENDTGEDLDTIALCGKFFEYANFTELQKEYDVPSMAALKEKTTVIPIPEGEGFIIRAY